MKTGKEGKEEKRMKKMSERRRGKKDLLFWRIKGLDREVKRMRRKSARIKLMCFESFTS